MIGGDDVRDDRQRNVDPVDERWDRFLSQIYGKQESLNGTSQPDKKQHEQQQAAQLGGVWIQLGMLLAELGLAKRNKSADRPLPDPSWAAVPEQERERLFAVKDAALSGAVIKVVDAVNLNWEAIANNIEAMNKGGTAYQFQVEDIQGRKWLICRRQKSGFSYSKKIPTETENDLVKAVAQVVEKSQNLADIVPLLGRVPASDCQFVLKFAGQLLAEKGITLQVEESANGTLKVIRQQNGPSQTRMTDSIDLSAQAVVPREGASGEGDTVHSQFATAPEEHRRVYEGTAGLDEGSFPDVLKPIEKLPAHEFWKEVAKVDLPDSLPKELRESFKKFQEELRRALQSGDKKVIDDLSKQFEVHRTQLETVWKGGELKIGNETFRRSSVERVADNVRLPGGELTAVLFAALTIYELLRQARPQGSSQNVLTFD